MNGPLLLVIARARRRWRRRIVLIGGLVLATAFAAAVAAQGTIAGDRAARSVLSGVPDTARGVTITWQGPAPTAAGLRARSVLRELGLGGAGESVLLGGVRLSGVVVRPAAVAPLPAWTLGSGGQPRGPGHLGPCRAAGCPVVLAGGAVGSGVLRSDGVALQITGRASLRSALALGFLPSPAQPPLLLSGDVSGLDSLAGLSGVYRTHSWFAPLALRQLHSWQLPALQAQLARAQAQLAAADPPFALSGPFAALDSARAQAALAPKRLLLVDGGALAALALFVLLAAEGLRQEWEQEATRLQMHGARARQVAGFVLAEAVGLAALSAGLGAAAGVLAAVVLAGNAGLAPGPVLAHSLLTPMAGAVLLVGTLVAALLLALPFALRGPVAARLPDALALAGAGALALALARGSGVESSSADPVALLLAPLACLAGGVVVFRGARRLLQAGELAFRRGPAPLRLAVVGLARSPGPTALAVAFVAVSTGLGVFALGYRATLTRGASDQARQQVPLDALVAAGPDFQPPLELAPQARWSALAGPGATVAPVRRTQATFPSGESTVTEPALGVPSGVLAMMEGVWRAGELSAPLPELRMRLRGDGPIRGPGPELPAGSRSLSVRVLSPALSLSVDAQLRGDDGSIQEVRLTRRGEGRISPSAGGWYSGRVPPGRWELFAFELSEGAGLQATNGHQNAENPGAGTQFPAPVGLGPARAGGASFTLASWHGVGAAAGLAPRLRFTTSGLPGVVRPEQPTDSAPLPVLTDPTSARSAGPGGILALTVDGQSVRGRVVGVLRRFPTVDPTAAGFVVADEARLSAALDAQLPGQGRPDELWISGRAPDALRRALAGGPLSELASSFRADVRRGLVQEPIARSLQGTLLAAAGLAGALAALGLLLALLGPGRDQAVEADLAVVGLGLRQLRRQLWLRLALAALVGALAGLAIGAGLAGLAVSGVQAAGAFPAPQPPLIAVIPWDLVLACVAAAVAVLMAVGAAGARTAVGAGRAT